MSKEQSNEVSLTNFLRKRIVDSSEEAPLRTIRVMVESPAGKDRVVMEEPFNDKFDPEAAAEEIISHMQRDANASEQAQVYIVRARYGLKDPQPYGGRWTLRCKPEEEEEEGDGEAIGAVGEGALLNQSYRHIQGLMSTSHATIGGLVQQVATMSQSAMGAMSTMMNSMALAEERRQASQERMMLALDNKAVRELEVSRELKKDARVDMALKLLMQYVPMYLADKSSSPPTALEMLVDNMTNEQIEKFSATLDNNQRVTFLQIIKAKAERQMAMLSGEAALDKRVKEIASSGTPDASGNGVQVREKQETAAEEAPAARVVPESLKQIKEALQGIDEEQFQKIAAILSPEQQMKLGVAMMQLNQETGEE